MKASELIAKLQELINKEGDLELFYDDSDFGACPINEIEKIVDKGVHKIRQEGSAWPKLIWNEIPYEISYFEIK